MAADWSAIARVCWERRAADIGRLGNLVITGSAYGWAIADADKDQLGFLQAAVDAGSLVVVSDPIDWNQLRQDAITITDIAEPDLEIFTYARANNLAVLVGEPRTGAAARRLGLTVYEYQGIP